MEEGRREKIDNECNNEALSPIPQLRDVFADGAIFKHGNLAHGIYVDPGRDVIGVCFSANPGEAKIPGVIRRAAKMLAEK